MEISELEPIVRAMQAISEAANTKRFDFDGKKIKASKKGQPTKIRPHEIESLGFNELKEQSFGEALGAGKCLQVLAELYPAEMDVLTAATE